MKEKKEISYQVLRWGPCVISFKTEKEFIDKLLDEAKRRHTGIVADAGVGVFDGVFDALVIGHRQGQQQRRYEIEAASQMVELADLGQGGQTPDGGAGRLNLQSHQRLLLGR